jgi:S-adenosyl-L-methionine hydrolase (adenosine-forming)
MITLLTDFGTADYFVPAVKGVILALQPQAQIIDLTHEIPAHDIAAAAFTLGACYHDFPAATIHLAVVDPGVGSARRAIVVEAGNYFLVGPDNGIFSFVYAREKNVRVFHATQAAYFRPSVHPTFHGRDVFAPLAAWLEKGLAPVALGEEINDYVRLTWASPQLSNDVVVGEIIHIDHFGNCITNLTAQELDWQRLSPTTRLVIGEQEVRHFGTHFAQSHITAELLAYPGSAGYWEIALWQDSAAKQLAVKCGTPVRLYR